jgi:hypothetical protein
MSKAIKGTFFSFSSSVAPVRCQESLVKEYPWRKTTGTPLPRLIMARHLRPATLSVFSAKSPLSNGLGTQGGL